MYRRTEAQGIISTKSGGFIYSTLVVHVCVVCIHLFTVNEHTNTCQSKVVRLLILFFVMATHHHMVRVHLGNFATIWMMW